MENLLWLKMKKSSNAETEGGYAKEMSEDYKKKQAKLIAETIAKQDIVICTALIPGKKAPVLISQKKWLSLWHLVQLSLI